MAAKTKTPEAPASIDEAPKLAKGTRLVGNELLDYVQDEKNRGIPESDLIQGAGYWQEQIKKATGEVYVQINSNPFYKALAAAKNLVVIPPTTSSGLSSGARRRFRVRANPNTGNVTITGSYLAEIGVKPGEYLKIETITESGELVLLKDEDQTGPVKEVPGQAELPLDSEPACSMPDEYGDGEAQAA